MTRLYCVVVALLLLAEVCRFGEGASNPGILARITRKGLEYAHQYGVAILKKELSTIRLPDISGSFQIGWVGSVSHEFHSLRIQHFELQNSNLSLLPEKGIRASLSNNYMSVSGNWEVKKAFITLCGTFDLTVDGISILVSLNLGKNVSGQPTASVAQCSNSIGHVRIDISGSLSWILNLFHERIENSIKEVLKQKICEMIRKSTTSHLEPFLQTLPVTVMIDQIAGIDCSLVGAPQVTSEGLDLPSKGEFFSLSQHTPIPFDAPAIMLPQQHDWDDHMIYVAVSEYVFNTASWVYYQGRPTNFTIHDKHLIPQKGGPSSVPPPPTTAIPLDSVIHLNTSSFRTVVPQLAKLYPDTEIELEVSSESELFVMFTPGNVTLVPVVDIRAFALLPNSSDRDLLFELRAKTNISATINVSSSKITGSVTTGRHSKLELELKHSNVGYFNVELLEAILKDHVLNITHPSLSAMLEKGFLLPLPRDVHLKSTELQIHKVNKKTSCSWGLTLIRLKIEEEEQLWLEQWTTLQLDLPVTSWRAKGCGYSASSSSVLKKLER
ncbi:PREDICTED: lipopolysaccharide-binding protein [Galeopterus variegatus]|uniref:Bactericidal permeability-increasing protein n=1 Tax=Galeopterus variegatus TaxID=482537 RepID=A0ABM0QZ81_GALVR|nr:PREDICTED: lipopolysaccharide-binding protein [Galeopterus variegatus]